MVKIQALPLLLCLSLLYAGAKAASVRILDGEAAEVGGYPYVASLQETSSSQHLCGAVIISASYVLTAAHCITAGGGIEPYPAHFFQVRAGSIQRLVGGQVVLVKRIQVHRDYADGLNDLALLELNPPLTLNDNVQPIALATASAPSGASVTVLGWGQTSTSSNIPQRLQWGSLQTLSVEECEEQLYLSYEGLLCLTRPASTTQGVCWGDAGGPAIYNGELVGIASFFVGDCGTEKPDGYVNISYYKAWVLENAV